MLQVIVCIHCSVKDVQGIICCEVVLRFILHKKVLELLSYPFCGAAMSVCIKGNVQEVRCDFRSGNS